MPDQTSGVAIEVAALYKSFTTRKVLQGTSLTIEPGEFVAIVGKSGCGKSTLLRLMAGLETPTNGAVTLGGQVPKPGSAIVRMMFQDPRLLPWQRVRDNVALGLNQERRADAADAPGRSGAGGSRQRLAQRPLWRTTAAGGAGSCARLAAAGAVAR